MVGIGFHMGAKGTREMAMWHGSQQATIDRNLRATLARLAKDAKRYAAKR